jgi:hypothetical protein
MTMLVEQDLSQVPGAMERLVEREIPGKGVVSFEEAPAGWLKKNGEPRPKPWRAYHWTPLAVGANRDRRISVTTMLDDICPKGGLPVWSEKEGIKGAVEALRLGLITDETTLDEAVGIVRAHKLGAENAKRHAAQRGLNVHALLEQYMLTGAAPKLSEHPVENRGYIRGLCAWLLSEQPEPVAVEQLVVHPEDGYAGRLDLRATIAGELVTVDLKTQERGRIYLAAHLQVNLYERAAVWCGDDPADRKMVVVVAANGEFRTMAADHEDWRIDAALAYWRAQRPISGVCESANRIEREARKAVSA